MLDEFTKLLHSKNPISSEQKHIYGKQLVDAYYKAQFSSEIFKWIIGGILYKIDKLGLHNYVYGKALSKKAFFEEVGIPPSTAQSRIQLWDFYIEQHKLKIEQVQNADIHKLMRGMVKLKKQNANTQEVLKVVELAERGKISRTDFLEEIK